MPMLIIESVYTKADENIPGYLEVLFEMNLGFYKAGVCTFQKINEYDLTMYDKSEFITDLKAKYGQLAISEMRITYDNDKYFLISSSFLLVLGYRLDSAGKDSNEFWIIEDLHGSNKHDLEEFYAMDTFKISE
jgi:hypothetical protein